MGAPEDEGCSDQPFVLEDGAKVERVRYGDEAEDWGVTSSGAGAVAVR